jgi:Ethylbenzene dehydrogenase
MRKPIFFLALSASLAAVSIAACGGDSSSSTPTSAATSAATAAPTATPTVAVAATDLISTKKAPAASLDAADPAWKDARVTTVKTSVVKGSAGVAPVDVKMQALNSDTDVWFRFEYSAAAMTTAKDWVYDGTKFKAASGQADRLSLFWEIKPSTDFEAKGCAALCHNPDTDKVAQWYMVAPTGSLFDNWQWTAGTSNGMKQASDKTLVDKAPDPTALGAPFVSDPTTNTAANPASTPNTNDAKDAPIKMQDPTKKPSNGPQYLLVSEAVALDVTKLKAGDKIPNAIIQPYTGDGADVDAWGTWANGTYTIVFHRKLDTGNADDTKFVVGNSYKFGLGVWLALGNVDHTVTTEAYTLKLAK